jgi:hypothetical protein
MISAPALVASSTLLRAFARLWVLSAPIQELLSASFCWRGPGGQTTRQLDQCELHGFLQEIGHASNAPARYQIMIDWS